MERQARFRFLGLTLVAALLFAGCSLLRRRAEAPPGQAGTAATTCPPLKVDGATAGLWVEALRKFIEDRKLQEACVLVRDGECFQDLPASVVEDVQRRVPTTRQWSFRCGGKVTVLTLKDDRSSDHRAITIGDGYDVTCKWTLRRTWFPMQSPLKSEGCVSAQSR